MVDLFILLPIRQHMVVQFIVGKIGIFHVVNNLLHHVGGKDGKLLRWVVHGVVDK